MTVRVTSVRSIVAFLRLRAMCHGGGNNRHSFLKRSLLTQGLLSVPTTVAPSERVFSIVGLVVQAKRSSLSPETVNNTVFVLNNAHLLKYDDD